MPEMTSSIRPLKEFPRAARKAVRFVLCDIDDTLTWEGRLPSRAYWALERLQAAGIVVVPVTGRPAGWCDHIARMWPVDAIVGENGSFYFRYRLQERRMHRVFSQSDQEREANREKLATLASIIVQEVPGAAISADQLYRETDLAIDFSEDVPPLSRDKVARIVEIFKAHGAQAKVSSIHVNGWFGTHNKRTMVERFLKEEYGHDLAKNPEAVVFVGDSPNDAPLFAGLPHGVGVANISDFLDQISTPPTWITERPGGLGFAELADALLEARSEGPDS